VTEALWYLFRGCGVVVLVLSTVVVTLGVATRSGRPVRGLPRFADLRFSAGQYAIYQLRTG
jgi:sulfoxide reductase heme-binding subunit YedZ